MRIFACALATGISPSRSLPRATLTIAGLACKCGPISQRKLSLASPLRSAQRAESDRFAADDLIVLKLVDVSGGERAEGSSTSVVEDQAENETGFGICKANAS